MIKLSIASAVAVFSFALLACPSTASQKPAPAAATTDAATANTPPNAVATTSGTDASAIPPGAGCPAPKKTTEACAAVMTWVMVNGQCCTYGSPCEAPDGPQFSDNACTHPMH